MANNTTHSYIIRYKDGNNSHYLIFDTYSAATAFAAFCKRQGRTGISYECCLKREAEAKALQPFRMGE